MPVSCASSVSRPSAAAAASRALPPVSCASRVSCASGVSRASPLPLSRRNSASDAASTARISTAPTSGSRRPFTTYMPSPSTKTEKVRLRCRASSAVSSPSRDSFLNMRTVRSSFAAEPARANSSSFASLSGVATRVSARTLVYEMLPSLRASAVCGRFSSARAVRTRSRAGPILMPILQASHSAQEEKPSFQPPRRSKSAMRVIIRDSAALMRSARSAMRSPRRKSSSSPSLPGSEPAGVAGASRNTPLVVPVRIGAAPSAPELGA